VLRSANAAISPCPGHGYPCPCRNSRFRQGPGHDTGSPRG
jgi:hypothetical protein